MVNSNNNIFKNYVKVYKDYKINCKAYNNDFYKPFIINDKNEKEFTDEKFLISLPLENIFILLNDIKIYGRSKLNRSIIKLKDKNKLKL